MPILARRNVVRPLLAATLVGGLTAGLAVQRTPVGASAAASPIVALPGYQVSVFARGGAYSNPDPIVYDRGHVFVSYANLAAKDGTGSGATTIVEYDLSGKVLRTFSTPGHGDGMRVNPTTHQLWALSNEDANPLLFIIDPATGRTTRYTFPKTPHGGGYDDIAFTHGMIFMDASNPNLDKASVNVYPALDRVTLHGNSVSVTPVLMGNAMATDLASHTKMQLNLIDPDSLTFNPQGNLVLDNQAGAQQVFISNPGTPLQYVTVSPVGTQVDDTVWATAAQGRLLMSDTKANVIYQIRATFEPDTAYATTQSDSGVTGMVGTVAPLTGYVTPVAIGFGSPHGMIFVPGM